MQSLAGILIQPSENSTHTRHSTWAFHPLTLGIPPTCIIQNFHPLTLGIPPTYTGHATHSHWAFHPLALGIPPTHTGHSTHSRRSFHPLTPGIPPTRTGHSTHSHWAIHPLSTGNSTHSHWAIHPLALGNPPTRTGHSTHSHWAPMGIPTHSHLGIFHPLLISSPPTRAAHSVKHLAHNQSISPTGSRYSPPSSRLDMTACVFFPQVQPRRPQHVGQQTHPPPRG